MNDTQKWQLLALTVLLGFLLWLLAPVLTPFVVSALIAYLADPLADRLERRGLSRPVAVLMVFVVIVMVVVGALLLLLPMIEAQVRRLVESLPRYAEWLRGTALPWLEARTGIELAEFETERLVEMLRTHWQQAGGVAATVLGGISRSGLAVLAWVAGLLLVPVLTFYFLRDWDTLVARVRALLPRPVEPTVVRLASESDQVLGGFLRGQLSVMVSLGAIYAIGLWMAGIDLALLIGMLAGLVSFVPYLGVIVGAGAALIAALVQHGDWLHVLLVIGVFSVGQVLESFVLTPWLVGDRIGMHPVAVIFAVMAGGQLFGFLGVLLALPVAAVVMVLLRYAHERYTQSGLYAGAGSGDAASAAAAETGATNEPTADAERLQRRVASARAAAAVAPPAEPGADAPTTTAQPEPPTAPPAAAGPADG